MGHLLCLWHPLLRCWTRARRSSSSHLTLVFLLQASGTSFNAHDLLEKAEEYLAQCQADLANQFCSTALQLEPDSTRALECKALALIDLNRHPEARVRLVNFVMLCWPGTMVCLVLTLRRIAIAVVRESCSVATRHRGIEVYGLGTGLRWGECCPGFHKRNRNNDCRGTESGSHWRCSSTGSCGGNQ